MNRVLDYIEIYLADDLSVIELSNIACLSPYHFGKMFKCSVGSSVHQYVLSRRVERAKSMLLSRTLALSEIRVVVRWLASIQTLFSILGADRSSAAHSVIERK
jgi:AraC family transcriptional regulator